jgi:hypothetical protein
MKFGKKLLTIGLTILMLLGAVAIMTVIAGAEETQPALRVAYCNLSYKDNVYIKYAVKADNVADFDDVKLLIWINPQSEYVLGTQSDVLEPLYTEKINGVDHIIYDYTKLAARQMTDVVYARACVEVDGEVYYSPLNKYSVLQYAYNMLGKTAAGSNNAKLKQLLTDMLTYGASAQNYAGYQTDRLATMEFYQVVLKGGALDDTCKHGLYLPGDQIVLHAPATDGTGGTFAYWTDINGSRVTLNSKNELTVGDVNNAYTPVYLKYSVGLEFESNGDGTCCLIGMGDCTDTAIVIPMRSPEGDLVTEIASSVFRDQPITSVTLPESLTDILRRAFMGCTSLTDVYYDGSEAQWSEVNIASGNEPLEEATVHFGVKTIYTVTFVDYNGKVLKKTTVVKGEAATAPVVPKREGFAFIGWDQSFESVEANLKVTAVYKQTVLPVLSVENVTVNKTAGTVDVAVSIKNNSGLAALRFLVDYDSDRLTLTKVNLSEIDNTYLTAPEPFGTPQAIMLMSPLKDTFYDGTIAVLTFELADAVEVGDVLSVELILDEENIIDSQFNPVEIDVAHGSVTVTN